MTAIVIGMTGLRLHGYVKINWAAYKLNTVYQMLCFGIGRCEVLLE